MRKLLIFTFLIILSSGPINLAAQSKKYSYRFDNVTVSTIIQEIESTTDYRFFFNAGLLDTHQSVSLEVNNASIGSVLDRVFSPINISYKIIDKDIILTNQIEKSSLIVKGNISDINGEPLPGVTIFQKNDMSQGISSDIDGNYIFKVNEAAGPLVFSCLGYVTQQYNIKNKKVINVIMTEDSYLLDEAVAIGYGMQKRSDITGSITSVNVDKLSKAASSSINSMLSGKAAGMQVRQTSAQPGGGVSIVIRGAGSDQAGNAPLYVIDGFPINNSSVDPAAGDYSAGTRDPLSTLNPADIASIEILKDAASTAIYGARAANGVILITTKRGGEGKTKVDLSYTNSVQIIDRYFDMLNAKEFMEYSNIFGKEQYLISNNQEPYGFKPQDFTYYKPKFSKRQIAQAGEGTDWWDEVTRTGMVHDANLSISGGNAKTKFMVSSNYFNQKGLVVNSDFSRFTVRLNLDHSICKGLDFGLSATGSYVDNGNVPMGGDYSGAGVLVAALQMSPLCPVYDELGNYYINPNDATLPNPVSFREINDHTIQKRLLSNGYLQYSPLKGLAFKALVGADVKSGMRSSYLPTTFIHGAAANGKASKALDNNIDLLANLTASYNATIKQDHTLNALLGYEYQLFTYDGFSADAMNFFTDSFGSDNLGAGKGVPTVKSHRSGSDLASFFARFSYSYKGKYIFNTTLRADGSSNFGSGNKWGFFPSFSFAWRMTEEPFMDNVDWINIFKIRTSFGQTGNSGIGDKAFAYFGKTRFPFAFGTDNIVMPANKIQAENPNLKWETTTEFNIALDYGFLENRITGTIEYYNKVVSDLLSSRVMPVYSELRTVADNIGSTQLSGVEFELHTVNIDREFKWKTDLNLSSYQDHWKERNPNVPLQPWQKPHDRIRNMYGYITEGIVQVGQDVPHMENELPGNLIYKDINGFDENHQLTGKPDGKISDADIANLGSTDPLFSFGFGNTFEWKGVDLTIFFYGMAGRKLLNTNKQKYILGAARLPDFDNNMSVGVKDVFVHTKETATAPGLASNPYPGYSDYLIEDASFLRLKNVTLGYTVPRKLLHNKAQLRVFADLQNLFVLTKYTGVDPEFDSLGAYPNSKSFSFGLNVSF